jgi:hypothetical protein
MYAVLSMPIFFLIRYFKERDAISEGTKIPHLSQFEERDEKSVGAKSPGQKI